MQTTAQHRTQQVPIRPPAEQAREAAESIVLPQIGDWQGQKQFIHEATVGLQIGLLQRFAAKAIA